MTGSWGKFDQRGVKLSEKYSGYYQKPWVSHYVMGISNCDMERVRVDGLRNMISSSQEYLIISLSCCTITKDIVKIPT